MFLKEVSMGAKRLANNTEINIIYFLNYKITKIHRNVCNGLTAA